MNLGAGGLLSRSAGAGLAVVFYLGKSVVPLGLIPNYPDWTLDPPTLLQFLPWVGVGVLLFGLWRFRGAASRAALFGLGFFLLNALPVLGFVPMSYLAISRVADHFAYLPLVGLVGLAAAGFGDLFSNRKAGEVGKTKLPGWISDLPALPVQVVLFLGFSAVVAMFAISSHRYARVFQGDESFWTYTVGHNPDSWSAQYILGMDLSR